MKISSPSPLYRNTIVPEVELTFTKYARPPNEVSIFGPTGKRPLKKRND